MGHETEPHRRCVAINAADLRHSGYGLKNNRSTSLR